MKVITDATANSALCSTNYTRDIQQYSVSQIHVSFSYNTLPVNALATVHSQLKFSQKMKHRPQLQRQQPVRQFNSCNTAVEIIVIGIAVVSCVTCVCCSVCVWVGVRTVRYFVNIRPTPPSIPPDSVID